MDLPMSTWKPPTHRPAIPWEKVEDSLRCANRWPNAHQLSPWKASSSRRAAVAVLLWGDPKGAQEICLIRRGHGAPTHAGEMAFPGGMVDPEDRDLPCTARRELCEELGIKDHLFELGCFPDGVAKGWTRFTPVFFRWEDPQKNVVIGYEIQDCLMLPLHALMEAPWQTENLVHQETTLLAPRLELELAPLWGATAFVLKAWLDLLRTC